MTSNPENTREDRQSSKADERNAFVFLAVLLAPITIIVLVGAYGFLLWMSQLVFGPPTH